MKNRTYKITIEWTNGPSTEGTVEASNIALAVAKWMDKFAIGREPVTVIWKVLPS